MRKREEKKNMTKEEFAEQAARECASEETTAHRGGGSGRPYWNAVSFQFMYAPAFQFQPIPGTKKYRYVINDANGNVHSFEAAKASAILSPVWRDIPEGVTTLKVYALDEEDNETYAVGTRTFFRLASFPSDLPPAARGYKEASNLAYEYAISQNFLLHWLNKGTPDPDYDHNVYPSKMISAVISGMLEYAKICPERESDAVKIAVNSADYLISITPSSGPMEGIPPTYQIDFRPDPETRKNLKAAERIDWVMMIYPAGVGMSYLELEAKTKDKKYFDAALKIGEYYRDHVEENGTWYLIRNINTGEVIAQDFCDPLRVIVPFLMSLYERTGEKVWKELADASIAYVEKTANTTYSWGAQFEDSKCSANYSNLSHYGAAALVKYYTKYYPDDPERMAAADDLMRFIEDQFVVWKKPSPWNKSGYDTSDWPTPCGLEQYSWHVPIDSSAADILSAFLAMYRAGRGELHLEKAKALADSITRVQYEDGMIPTHWMTEKHRNGVGLWINCLFNAAGALAELGSFLGE